MATEQRGDISWTRWVSHLGQKVCVCSNAPETAQCLRQKRTEAANIAHLLMFVPGSRKWLMMHCSRGVCVEMTAAGRLSTKFLHTFCFNYKESTSTGGRGGGGGAGGPICVVSIHVLWVLLEFYTHTHLRWVPTLSGLNQILRGTIDWNESRKHPRRLG